MSAAPSDTLATVTSLARRLVARDVDHERIAHACAVAPSLPHDERTAAVLSTVAFLVRSRDEWASRALTTRSHLDALAASLALGVDIEQTSDADLFARVVDELRARDARYLDALATVEALTRRAEQAEAARTALAFAVGWTPATLANITSRACAVYLRARDWWPRPGDSVVATLWTFYQPYVSSWTVETRCQSPAITADDVRLIASREHRDAAFVVADLIALSAESKPRNDTHEAAR